MAAQRYGYLLGQTNIKTPSIIKFWLSLTAYPNFTW